MHHIAKKLNKLQAFCFCLCFIIVVLSAKFCLSLYFYNLDNEKREESIVNICKFRDKIKMYLAAHERQYPDEKGVKGLCQLDIVKLSDFAAKNDRNVNIDYDIMMESNTSYAYVASGISEKNLTFSIPVLFEKPWNRENILILFSDGAIKKINARNLKSCHQVIQYLQHSSIPQGYPWEILYMNALYIDKRHE